MLFIRERIGFGSKSFLDRRMKSSQEWYMNAEEAVEFGFADSILGDDNSPSIEELANV